MAKEVIIDDDECSGCGTCAALAGDCFALNDEIEKAYVIDESACTVASGAVASLGDVTALTHPSVIKKLISDRMRVV